MASRSIHNALLLPVLGGVLAGCGGAPAATGFATVAAPTSSAAPATAKSASLDLVVSGFDWS